MSAATAAGGNKQAELSKNIAATLIELLVPIMDKQGKEMADHFAEIITRLGALEARFEVLESVSSGAKKATKTTAGKAATAAKGKAAAGKGKAAAEDPREKVKNSMLYFRWALANDEKFREEYVTADLQEVIDADENIAKKKDEKEKWLAAGSLLWKSHLTDDQKKEIRTLYNEWSKQREQDALAADGQLEDDGAENGDAE